MFYHTLIVIDEAGTPLTTKGDEIYSDKELADIAAQDWNDYMASKGMPKRMAVITWEHDQ